jgi:hypothetical protein
MRTFNKLRLATVALSSTPVMAKMLKSSFHTFSYYAEVILAAPLLVVGGE